jgi:hypothetical protein
LGSGGIFLPDSGQLLDPGQPVISTHHELSGHRCPVRAAGEVGAVDLDPGQRLGLGFQFTVDTVDPIAELDEPVPFDRCLTGDGVLGLRDRLVDPGSVRRARSRRYR